MAKNISHKHEKFCVGCHAHAITITGIARVGMLIANDHMPTSEDVRGQGNALVSIYYFSGGNSTKLVTLRIRILLNASYSG